MDVMNISRGMSVVTSSGYGFCQAGSSAMDDFYQL
jgi:hypothetical protein